MEARVLTSVIATGWTQDANVGNRWHKGGLAIGRQKSDLYNSDWPALRDSRSRHSISQSGAVHSAN